MKSIVCFIIEIGNTTKKIIEFAYYSVVTG